MKNILLILTILLIFVRISLAQNTFRIIDSSTNNPIPFVNICLENANEGLSANEKGEFSLISTEEQDYVVFSAVGYKRKRIDLKKLSDEIYLIPYSTELAEVIVKPSKGKKSLVVGKLKRKKINTYYGNQKGAWIIARYFSYTEEYNKTPFIKEIKIATSSRLDSACFNVRLYKKDKSGNPGDYLFYKNLIVSAPKHNQNSRIDLSNVNLKFPEEGFFIAIECLAIEQNKFTLQVTKNDEFYPVETYQPSIGIIGNYENEETWVYYKGSWMLFSKYSEITGYHKNWKNRLIAIELKLTN